MKAAHTVYLSVKVSSFVFVSVALLLYFGKQLSDGDRQLIFSNYNQFTTNVNITTSQTSFVASSPSYNKPAAIFPSYKNPVARREVHSDKSVPVVPDEKSGIPLISPSSPRLVERFGVVDENGIMSNVFRIGDFSNEIMQILSNVSSGSEGVDELDDVEGTGVAVGVTSFVQCPVNMTDYVPCLDYMVAENKLHTNERGEYHDRHCPEKGKGLNCLIHPPRDYKRPIPWPKSREEIWCSNVPHAQLDKDEGGQNGISIAKDKIQFSGDDTQYIHVPDQYINHISKMVTDIAFGQRTRVVLDIGCGVASFGAHLMSRNVLTLSLTPKDVHKNQVQYALERGVPAMVAALATQRLVYPSQGFDLIHFSECGIDWTRDDGILLLELNRILRAGRYFVYAHGGKSNKQWEVMAALATRLCWQLVAKEEHIAIWRKPQDNVCYVSRREGTQPPLCDTDDDPDNVWNAALKTCIGRLPENGYGANVTTWPMRLHSLPDRLQTINIDASISRKELYRAEFRYADEIVGNNVKVMRWKEIGIRNVLDMRAGFGGFAAALINQKIDCWVMNVVPVSEPNTLPVIFDRGLLGVMHDWCEPFDTYPRTYDLLHASGLFSVERSRCDISSIMLEMDRILRPGGYAYIQDSVTVIYRLQELGNAMGWHMRIQDTGEGPQASHKILICEKQLNRENRSKDDVRHRRRHRKSHKRSHD